MEGELVSGAGIPPPAPTLFGQAKDGDDMVDDEVDDEDDDSDEEEVVDAATATSASHPKSTIPKP